MKIDKENLMIILLAGGLGKRLDKKTSKQLITYKSISILERNIKKFNEYLDKVKIQVVSNKRDFKKITKITNENKILPPVLGGGSRHKSVFNGLEAIKFFDPKFVLIHDSARPLITFDVINKLIKHCKKNISCVIPVLPVSDSIRISSDGIVNKVVTKKNKVLVQTPQLCNYKDLVKAHSTTTKTYEDESSLFLSKSKKVFTIAGDPLSLKITYKNDLKLLEPHLSKEIKYITKVGNGFDIHRFDIKKRDENNYIILGGIKIFNVNPLIGHSDADVLLHAITDSILGIVNKGDIGKIFPPSDKKWKNADSSLFLSYASRILKEAKGKINNIDAIIICEKPKILDYSKKIQENIAKILKISPKRISIKGKTSESVGFIGRKEGLAAMACTSVEIVENIFDDQ